MDRLSSFPARSGDDEAALALAATKKIKVEVMALSPYSTHPVYIAMVTAYLDEMYPGRVILCLGSRAPRLISRPPHRIADTFLVAIGEAVKICRQLFAGEMADFHGQMFAESRGGDFAMEAAPYRSCSRRRGATCFDWLAGRPTAC